VLLRYAAFQLCKAEIYKQVIISMSFSFIFYPFSFLFHKDIYRNGTQGQKRFFLLSSDGNCSVILSFKDRKPLFFNRRLHAGINPLLKNKGYFFIRL